MPRSAPPASTSGPRINPAALRVLSAFVLAALIAAGFLGTQDTFRNITPTFVWVVWWIGFTYLCMVFGDLWALAAPWRLLNTNGRWKLPDGVGAWPAVALLLIFAWMETAWHGNAVPRNLAWLLLGYAVFTCAAMWLFGSQAWLKSGELFSVYFAFVGRVAPLEWRAGLLEPRPLTMSQAAFVICMLAVVSFDGLRETPLWTFQGGIAYALGLLLVPLLFSVAIIAACREHTRLLVPTLLPIALAYHVAHYLTFLLIAGQGAIALVSDPLGRGWDLFGTADYQVDTDFVGARFAWYTSVTVIVAGHVLAMYAARRAAPGHQVRLAVLMVAYTVLSLWMLAQPVVEA